MDGARGWERTVLDALGLGLVVMAPGGAFAYLNAAAARWLGTELDDVRGRTPDELGWRVVDADGVPLDPAERPSARVRRLGRTDDVVVGIDRPEHARAWVRVRAWPLESSVVESSAVESSAVESSAADMPAEDDALYVVAQLEEVTDARHAEQQRQLQSRLLDAVGQAVIATDLSGVIVYWGPAAEAMSGYPAAEVMGRRITEVTPAPGEEDHAEEIMARLSRGETWSGEFPLRRRDGSVYPAVVTNSPWHDEHGRLAGIIGVSMDISDRIAVEQEALHRAEAQTAVARLGQEALRTDDVDGFLTEVVATVAEVVGATRVSVLETREGGGYVRLRASTAADRADLGASFPVEPGSRLDEALSGEATVLADDRATLSGDVPGVDAMAGLRSSASVPLATRGEVVGCLVAEREEAGPFSEIAVTVLQSVANVVAATLDRERADRDLQHLALHDPLTGLPNRTLFTDRLALALARRERADGDVALLFTDLDRFKQVNDGLGHAVGDRLLLAVATRMQSAVRASDTVARLSGDEFAVLCEDLAGPEDAVALAERLALAFAHPFDIDGNEVAASTSIGIAVAADRDTPDSLLRHADAAMYEAKERGRNRYEVFDEALASTASTRGHTAAGLRRATDAGELALRFQPVRSLGDERVEVVEALLRWDDPARGLVAPDDFLDVAEETGAIVEMGRWVLDRACREASAWPAADGGRAPAVAVNLSPRQLVHPGLVDLVSDALSRHGLAAGRLWLEVTEAAVTRHPEETARVLRDLEELGVRLVLDDVGTGYSSLSALRDVPLHALKVDRSFVAGEGAGLADRTVVGAAIGLAHSFGLVAVAVGVETSAQVAALRTLGCDLAQGYHWEAPAAAEDLGDWLVTGTARGG